MRRRLWWNMCAIDARAAEDHGIALNNSDTSSDTRLPINIDDSELSPNMQELPVGKSKWTEMTFCLTMLEITNEMRRLYRAPEAPVNISTAEPSRDQIVNDLMTRVQEKYLRHCDCNIPIQNGTQLCGRLLLAKLRFMISQPQLNRCDAKKHPFYASEDALVAACRILEMSSQLQTDDLLRGFRWYFETFTQYHLLTYVLWHLCVKPVGPSVERAWSAIDGSFEIADNRNISCEPWSKWTMFQQLREKAMRIRSSCNMEGPIIDGGLKDLSGMNMINGGLENTTGLMFGDDQNWDFNTASFDMRDFEGADFSI